MQYTRSDRTRISDRYFSPTVDSITAKCDSVEICLYDKAHETIEAYYKSAHSEMCFVGIDTEENGESFYTLARLEFRIRKKNPLNDYFFFDNPNKRKDNSPSPRFAELSQLGMEKVYKHLVDKFFAKTYEKYHKNLYFAIYYRQGNPRLLRY